MTSQRISTVAAIQMISTPDITENIEAASRLVSQAAEEGACLVSLPEYWPLMAVHERDKLAQAEAPHDGPIQLAMREMAARHKIWLCGGTLPLISAESGKVRNTLMVYGPDGEPAARYDKMHLFSFTRGKESYDESRSISAGDAVVTVDTVLGKVGLSVCYDLRFPELYRALGACNLIVVPSAFTYTTGSAHWEVLLRARAIENQCYVLAAAQGGTHENGRRTWGHSMLIDPWGEIVASLDEGEGVVCGKIDLDYLASVRENLPALRHRRTNFSGENP